MTRILFPLAGLMALVGLAAFAGDKIVETETADTEAEPTEIADTEAADAEPEALVFLHALDNQPIEFT